MKNNFETESLKSMAVIYKNKKFIIIFTSIVTIAALIYSILMPMQFKSTVNVVQSSIDESSVLGGSLGNISSKLKDFGLTKLGGGSSGGKTYDISVILESRSVLDSMIYEFKLAQRYEIPDTAMTKIRKEFLSNLSIVDHKDGNIEISVWDEDPKMASIMANRFVEIVNAKSLDMNKKETIESIKYMENRIKITDERLIQISDSLSIYSSKNLIFSPEDQSKALSNVISNLQAMIMSTEIEYEISKNRYGLNDPTTLEIKNTISDLKKKLENILTEPGTVGNFSPSEAGKVGIEYMRLYTEFEAFTKLKLMLLPTLEKSKLDLLMNTISIFVVDEAIPLEKKDRPKRAYIVLGALFGSLFLATFFVLITNSFIEFKKKYNAIAV